MTHVNPVHAKKAFFLMIKNIVTPLKKWVILHPYLPITGETDGSLSVSYKGPGYSLIGPNINSNKTCILKGLYIEAKLKIITFA